MNDYEIWYQFCMPCKYAYIRKEDADTVYCSVPKHDCPHKDEIEQAKRKEE